MAGIVKRKYFSEMIKYKKGFTRPLSLITEVLPVNYDKYTILNLFKEFYPLEWGKLVQRYELYKDKDLHLQKVGKKKRYYHDVPEIYFFNLAKVKHLLSEGQRNKHRSNFELNKTKEAFGQLAKDRQGKIQKNVEKVNISKKLIQSVEPLYVDIFISAYHDKVVTIKDKIEIFNELKKYDCQITREFFQKLNDSERNNQVRRMAFEHLQKIGAFVKLRKNFKGKVKLYAKERDDFNVTPIDLVERIKSDSIQNKKSYDVFISHSYKDSVLIIALKNQLNFHNINVYCDWTNDNDFLRRELASEYTEVVLKKRIEQSSFILFVKTDNSMGSNGEFLSKWVEMEIDFAKKISKIIYCLNLNGGSNPFKVMHHEMQDQSFSVSKIEADKLRTNPIGGLNI